MLHRSMLHANEAGSNRSMVIVLIAARNRATENYSQTQLTHTLTKTGLYWRLGSTGLDGRRNWNTQHAIRNRSRLQRDD